MLISQTLSDICEAVSHLETCEITIRTTQKCLWSCVNTWGALSPKHFGLEPIVLSTRFKKSESLQIGQFSTSVSIFIHPLHIPKSAKFLLWSLKPFNFKCLAVATINNILRPPKKNTNGACLIGKDRTSPNTNPCYWCIHFSIGFTRLPQFFLSSHI